MYPVVSVQGSPYQRGRSYGRQARERIRRSLQVYAQAFERFADWDWAQATAQARRFVDPIGDYDRRYLDELQGIADGTGVGLADVVAINLRTEVMGSGRVRAATAGAVTSGDGSPAADAECSAFAALAPDGRVLAGQNWDWLPHSLDTLVVLRTEPDDDTPAHVSVVEAGLLAKFGVNAAGVAVLTNALTTLEDECAPGVPYHVLLRALLESESAQVAADRIAEAPRASSANYLVVDDSGVAVDVEARPGDQQRVHRLHPDERGLLLHTNHFCSPAFDGVDYSSLVVSSSPHRMDRLTELAGAEEKPYHAEFLTTAFTDHDGYPMSVCRHADTELHELDRGVTAASMVADLTARDLQVASGLPCTAGYEPVPWPAGAG